MCYLLSNFAAAETLDSYPGQVLTVVTHKPPMFFANASWRGDVSGLGAIAPGIEGKKMMQENQIPDPALAVAAKLSPMVAARSKASSTASIGDVDPLSTTDVAKLVSGKGLILEIWTFAWAFRPLAMNTDHYVVQYDAMARILDAAGNPLAGARCATFSKDILGYDDLIADHAAGLKSQFATESSTCADAFAKVLLAPPAATQADTSSKSAQ